MSKSLEENILNSFKVAFEQDPKNRLARNAVTKNGLSTVALNRDIINQVSHTYAHVIETPEATSQGATGRCWLFAGLNVLRLAAIQTMKLKELELSQTYLMFWDKLEKANFFLENIISTRDEPLSGRLVMWLLADPISDAGQWDMFVGLVQKYGVVPKNIMPETASTRNSREMNAMLVAKLRHFAQQLRDSAAAGTDVIGLRDKKLEMLKEFYRMLVIHLGCPPQTFVWAWRDKEDNYQSAGEMSPKNFYQNYIGLDLNDFVCLINAPTADKPFSKLYTVQHLGNIVDGPPVRYINVTIKQLKQAAYASLLGGNAVWFGSDSGKFLERKLGVLDIDVYDLELVYDVSFGLDKAGRLDYGHSRMTHAMVLTGVDTDVFNVPVKWKVENSWGTKVGDEGYFLMTDRWADEYVYEIAVHKQYIDDALLSILDTEPIVLPPWDPMGALA